MNKIYLRKLVESDINDRYLNSFRDKNVIYFLEVDGEKLTQQSVINYINEGSNSKEYFMYAICLSENNQHIGNVKIGPIDYKHMRSDLVTVLWDVEHWGKGIATEAIKEGNKIAFEVYNIRKLNGGIYENNIGSINAYIKAGWFIEANLKDHYILNGKYLDRDVVSCFNPNYDQQK